MSSIDFASLLCSRLCHDLIGPVGSLFNGVELLADETDPDMRDQCLKLLNDTALQTANKLKFFRLAFGAAGGFGETVDAREVQAAIEGVFQGGRVELEWLVHVPSLPKPAVKVILNLALLAGDALLRGGKLQIAAEPAGDSFELALRAEGGRMLLGDDLRAALRGDVDLRGVTPRAAPAYLVHCLLDEYDSELMLSEPAEGVLVFGSRFRLAEQAAS